jgi:disulfide bond formation protein DsbB
MLARDPVQVRTNPAAAAAVALAIAAIGAATILGAWFFEYGLGLAPCPLCLQQRIAYYVAIPLAVVVALAAWRRAPRALIVAGLGVIVVATLINAGLGVYHSGIEWKWWPGPQDCSGPLVPLGSRDLLEQLQSVNVVRCDEAPWSFLGLSLAGYNVLISGLMTALALWGIAAVWRAPA